MSCESEVSEAGGVFDWLREKRNEVTHPSIPQNF